MASEHDPLDIVGQAFCMVGLVQKFTENARLFYYAVMLSGYACPECGGFLEMLVEGRCGCRRCGRDLDPTLAFQRCSHCGGSLQLHVRRYECRGCKEDVPSRFLFDGLVFNAEYFRQKMAESRKHRRELRERVRQMLAESRSAVLETPAIELDGHLDLLQALNALIGGQAEPTIFQPASPFDLKRYQRHVMAHIRPIAVNLEQIPPLSENRRRERVWRFIAIIFLAHAGLIDIWQNGQDIMVKQSEVDPERPGVPGDLEEADGIEGSVC
jgi:hypothetical protein